jgi:multiple sugar transport system permease protein
MTVTSTAAIKQKAGRRGASINRREAIAGYLFISPWIVGFVLFVLGPFLASLYFSFTTYSVLQPGKWVGLDNYVRALSGADRFFWKSLWNTTYYVVGMVTLRLVLGFFLALLLNKKVRGITVWRTLFYVPSIVPIVAVSIIWLFILNPKFGLVNYGLSLIGIDGPGWMTSPVWSKPGLILVSVTWVGVTMLIFLAGLQDIPAHLYEAAELDGASPWRQMLNITVPLMTPTIFFNLIINIIQGFQVFAQVLVMTSGSGGAGGPLNSTRVYVLHLFELAFNQFKMGYASALAWILFIIVLLLTLVMVKTSDRWVFYN